MCVGVCARETETGRQIDRQRQTDEETLDPSLHWTLPHRAYQEVERVTFLQRWAAPSVALRPRYQSTLSAEFLFGQTYLVEPNKLDFHRETFCSNCGR